MKKFTLLLFCLALVVGLQVPKDKIALATDLEIKQQLLLLSEKDSKEPNAEKPVDSTTESTKKKKYK